MHKERKTPLTSAEKATLDNLQRIWRSKKKQLGLTQEKAAHAFGWTAQANISQYLTGRRTLGLEVGLKFAKVLEVEPSEINPDWAEHDSSAVGHLTPLQRGIYDEIKLMREDQLQLLDQLLKQMNK